MIHSNNNNLSESEFQSEEDEQSALTNNQEEQQEEITYFDITQADLIQAGNNEEQITQFEASEES